MRADAGDLQGWFILAQPIQPGDEIIDEGGVGRRQGGIGPFDGDEKSAGEHILRERLFEQAMALDAGAAGRQEADVVVGGPFVPGRREDADGERGGQPAQADEPGMRRREASELVKHCVSPLVNAPLPKPRRGRRRGRA